MTEDRCDLICIDAPRAEAIREKLLVKGRPGRRRACQGTLRPHAADAGRRVA